ncbi:GNAT family N-acetyltransferase [Tengunoibacter tsumagoiensis]|uniref:N-acetyltransferase domain-containing protein n=1 Tax=Tengunoibacter tsumagoiensis TaxID=2014871 RepID=A0A402A2U7_9CHLR|nr:GNAT family N-acetyltransferase [Tengunoibacter tsumagoiensis]GCE13454.1 hypothetical protein KTT_33130 [Tengunoibacter tsumagoiensis]
MDQVRAFCEEDRAGLVALDNRERPPYRQYTVEDHRQIDAQRSPHEVYRRLVVGEPIVAYLEVVDMGTTPPGFRSVKGTCEIELSVAKEQRRQGIGSALYEQALHFARERNANTLRAWFYQYGSETDGIDFLVHRGFVEEAQRQTWQIDLTRYDFAELEEYAASMEWQGIRILAYGIDLLDTPEGRQNLFQLDKELEHIPPEADYTSWVQSTIEQTDWEKDVYLIAELNGKWIACSSAKTFNREERIARIPYTGTLPAYQGRGIATTLKLRVMQRLQQQGYRMLLTSNRKNNEPILAINQHLGFQPGPIELTYKKMLR